MLFSLSGHAHADFIEEPTLEFLTRLQCAATDDECVGIEGIHHFVEEEAQGMGLHSEYVFAQRIAFVGEAAYKLGRLVGLELCEIVIWVARKKIRHKISFDRREGAKRLKIANAAAIA